MQSFHLVKSSIAASDSKRQRSRGVRRIIAGDPVHGRCGCRRGCSRGRCCCSCSCSCRSVGARRRRSSRDHHPGALLVLGELLPPALRRTSLAALVTGARPLLGLVLLGQGALVVTAGTAAARIAAGEVCADSAWRGGGRRGGEEGRVSQRGEAREEEERGDTPAPRAEMRCCSLWKNQLKVRISQRASHMVLVEWRG